jgi:hypothetical protein
MGSGFPEEATGQRRGFSGVEWEAINDARNLGEPGPNHGRRASYSIFPRGAIGQATKGPQSQIPGGINANAITCVVLLPR